MKRKQFARTSAFPTIATIKSTGKIRSKRARWTQNEDDSSLLASVSSISVRKTRLWNRHAKRRKRPSTQDFKARSDANVSHGYVIQQAHREKKGFQGAE